jgi:hypothetical protein
MWLADTRWNNNGVYKFRKRYYAIYDGKPIYSSTKKSKCLDRLYETDYESFLKALEKSCLPL